MIEASNLTKFYDAYCAVDNISVSIRKGEITGLLGPNGAGKTTTMRMITGYFPPSSGKIEVDGIDISLDPIAVKKMIGYLPESAPLYGDMIVYDYLKFAADIHNISDPSRISETAALCGLTDVMHKNINQLSKGYRQRVGLAHAMIHDPEILILDEPTTGLDPNQIIEIRSLIKEIGKKKTIILSTHILSEVEATCDRVIIINKGKIVTDSKTEDLQRSYKNMVQINLSVKGGSFTDVSAALATIGASDVKKIAEEDGIVSLTCSSSAAKDIRPEIFTTVKDRGWMLYELARSQNTLEMIFKDLTSGGENA